MHWTSRNRVALVTLNASFTTPRRKVFETSRIPASKQLNSLCRPQLLSTSQLAMGQTWLKHGSNIYGLPVHPEDWSDLVLSHPFAQHELHISISDGAKTQASLITEGEKANAWWGKGRVRADHDHGCFLMSRNFRQQKSHRSSKVQLLVGCFMFIFNQRATKI